VALWLWNFVALELCPSKNSHIQKQQNQQHGHDLNPAALLREFIAANGAGGAFNDDMTSAGGTFRCFLAHSDCGSLLVKMV